MHRTDIHEGAIPTVSKPRRDSHHRNQHRGSTFFTEMWLSTDGRVRIGMTNALGVGAQPAPTDRRWVLPEATVEEHEAFNASVAPILAAILDATDPAEQDRLHRDVEAAAAAHYVLSSTEWPLSEVAGVTRALEWKKVIWPGILNAALNAQDRLHGTGVALTIPYREDGVVEADTPPVEVRVNGRLHATVPTAGARSVGAWSRRFNDLARAAATDAQPIAA